MPIERGGPDAELLAHFLASMYFAIAIRFALALWPALDRYIDEGPASAITTRA